jgi:starvation-inducible DNA-binding protein
MVEKLLEDHDTLIRQLRDDQDKIADKFGDAGNQDSIIGWMKTHEKMAWMLRSIVEGWNS